jgi:hypothetical protein
MLRRHDEEGRQEESCVDGQSRLLCMLRRLVRYDEEGCDEKPRHFFGQARMLLLRRFV